jgi:hypothetical protein
MNKATDYERLLAGLPGAPEGERRGLMRLLADAADGARLPNRAAGWRWLADNHRWPRECEWPQGSDLVGWARFGWSRFGRDWSDLSPDDLRSAGLSAHLPVGAYRRLPRSALALPVTHVKAFGSVTEALEQAARAAGAWLRAGRAANTV